MANDYVDRDLFVLNELFGVTRANELRLAIRSLYEAIAYIVLDETISGSLNFIGVSLGESTVEDLGVNFSTSDVAVNHQLIIRNPTPNPTGPPNFSRFTVTEIAPGGNVNRIKVSGDLTGLVASSKYEVRGNIDLAQLTGHDHDGINSKVIDFAGLAVFTVDGIFTPPGGVTQVLVTAVGGGAGGGGGGGNGGGALSNGDGGGGGEAGNVARRYVNVTPLTPYNVVIGQGGTGGAGATAAPPRKGSTGGNGTATNFGGGLVVASGGLGGEGGNSNTGVIAQGGNNVNDGRYDWNVGKNGELYGVIGLGNVGGAGGNGGGGPYGEGGAGGRNNGASALGGNATNRGGAGGGGQGGAGFFGSNGRAGGNGTAGICVVQF